MIEELQRLIRPMDLPDFRKSSTTVHNLKWLRKNLKARNESHKNYEEAMKLLESENVMNVTLG